MSRKWVRALQNGVTAAIGLAISALTAWYQGFSPAQPFALNARYLSDGCFVAAVLLVGVGALCWISGTGFFDIFAYAVKSLLVLFTPLRRPRDQISFYDYKLLKASRRRAAPRFIVDVGVVFLGLSVLFLWLYHRG